MKKGLYGKKMFFADLLIVSLWALFSWHVAGCSLVMIAYVLLRLALCFELYRKSHWAFGTAILFALLFICGIFGIPGVKYVFEPIFQMIYVIGCLAGFSEEMFDLYSPYASPGEKFALWCVWAVIAAWLVLTPLISSIPYRCRIPLKALCRKHYILQNILNDKAFISYLALALTFSIAMLTGFFELYPIRKIVAFLTPISVYVIIVKITDTTPVRTIPALLLGIGGLLYVNVFNRVHECVIMLLVAGGCLSIAASAMTYRQTKSIISSLSLFIASAFVLPMFVLGYNPYANPLNDNVHPFGNHHRGLYMIAWNGNIGLRDRYGSVIPPQNKRIYFLDYAQNYVAVLEDEKYDGPDNYYVYCLPERRIVISSSFPINQITRISGNEFMLKDTNGRNFASVTFPLRRSDGYYNDLQFKPLFSTTETSIETFLDKANESRGIDPHGNRFWEEMRQSNTRAYGLLGKVLAMSGIEYSPANDLTFARAFAEIVRQDSYYKDNIPKAINELDAILDILGGGNQPDLNQCADICRLLESLRLSLSYDGLISNGDRSLDEYIAWHNLMEATISYYEWANYSCSSDWYSSKPMDMELEKAGWLRRRREFVDIENEIIAGGKQYLCSADSLKSIEDVLRVTDSFHCEYNPQSYHPVYHEVAPAFRDWIASRENVAKSLPADRAKSYREVTKELIDAYASIVERLDVPGMHPILDRDGRFFKYQRSRY